MSNIPETIPEPVEKANSIWRSGVSLPLRHKPEMEARMQALGIETVGQLLNLFVHGEGVVEALQPIKHELDIRKANRPVPGVVRREVTAKLSDEAAAKLRGMTTEQIDKLLAAT